MDLIKRLHPQDTDKRLIRIGGNQDGGYLIPDDLEGIEACFSPGVGDKSTFEFECAERGMKIFMADASVEKPGIDHPQFSFQKKYVGASRKKDFITLKDWMESVEIRSDSDLLLQMDIEGFEYEVLNATPDSHLSRFRVIVVEFHGMTNVGLPYFFQRYSKAFEKLLAHHTCVHIHPNNCCGVELVLGLEIPAVAEFTFLRTDRILHEKPVDLFPNPLDVDCVETKSIKLPEVWYR